MNKNNGIRNKIIEFVRKILLYPYGISQIRKHGFWFVDIPRTSGGSIKVELGRLFGFTYSKSKIFDEGNYGKPSVFPHHLTAQQMRDILGHSLWKKTFTFTLVRNPWDRMVSIYLFRKQLVQSIPPNMGFRDYILEFNNPGQNNKYSPFYYSGYYYGASDYVLDEHDNIIVDFIGKYENRKEDLEQIAGRISCPSLGLLHLQKTNRQQEHYSKYYDDETRDIIAQFFSKDIELFGYSF